MANGAVTSMVRNLAVELAPVRVNAIHSGAVGDSPAVTTRHDRGKPAKADLD
jgi:NAD(P)-dependent dehydrogenase (short-subunit alcohol dehydrogenase family)